MDRQVVRIMALGGSEALERAVADLVYEGYAVAKASGVRDGVPLLRQGDIGLVIADADVAGVAELAVADGGKRPWVMLAAPGSVVPDAANVLPMAVPVATDTLLDVIRERTEATGVRVGSASARKSLREQRARS